MAPKPKVRTSEPTVDMSKEVVVPRDLGNVAGRSNPQAILRTDGWSTMFRSSVATFQGREFDVGNGRKIMIDRLHQLPATRALIYNLDSDEILLVRQTRDKAEDGRKFMECPGGGVGKTGPETPLQNISHEIHEEAGFTPRTKPVKIRLGNPIFGDPGLGDATSHLYIVVGGTLGEAHPEQDEDTKRFWMSFSDAMDKVKYGGIDDAMSIQLILYFYVFVRDRLRNGESLERILEAEVETDNTSA